MAEICGKKQQNHLFQKSRNFAKSKRCRVLGPTFFGFLASFYFKNAHYRLEKILFSIFSLKRYISTTFVTTTLADFVDFCSYTQKLGYYQRFYFFMISRKYKKTTQLMQCPFTMCKVKIYMGIPRSLWLKWQECHSCDKKTKKLFSFSQ